MRTVMISPIPGLARPLARWLWALAVALGVLALIHASAAAAPDRQPPRPLTVDQPGQGQLSDAVTSDTWTFSGFAGDLVLIDMRAGTDGDLDPFLTLVDNSGATLMTDDDSGQGFDARIGPFTLPAEGSFTVLAGRYGGAGSYTLELRSLNTLPGIQIGKPVGGVVDADHPSDFFLLHIDSPDALLRLVALDDSDHVPPLLELFGPDGLIVSSEFLESTALDPVLPVPGVRYVVGVTWNSAYNNGGPYELRLEPSEVSLLRPGDSQAGTLDFETYSQQHFFRGEAGQRFRLSVTAEGDISPALDISSADYVTYLFSSSGEHTRTLTVEFEVPVTTVYVIEVRDGAFTGASGRYTLSLESAEN